MVSARQQSSASSGKRPSSVSQTLPLRRALDTRRSGCRIARSRSRQLSASRGPPSRCHGAVPGVRRKMRAKGGTCYASPSAYTTFLIALSGQSSRREGDPEATKNVSNPAGDAFCVVITRVCGCPLAPPPSNSESHEWFRAVPRYREGFEPSYGSRAQRLHVAMDVAVNREPAPKHVRGSPSAVEESSSARVSAQSASSRPEASRFRRGPAACPRRP
jgi:hypothetical protein